MRKAISLLLDCWEISAVFDYRFPVGLFMCRRRPHSNGLSVSYSFAGAAESRQTGWRDVIELEHDATRDYSEIDGVFYIA
jgi:hypothetical protein